MFITLAHCIHVLLSSHYSHHQYFLQRTALLWRCYRNHCCNIHWVTSCYMFCDQQLDRPIIVNDCFFNDNKFLCNVLICVASKDESKKRVDQLDLNTSLRKHVREWALTQHRAFKTSPRDKDGIVVKGFFDGCHWGDFMCGWKSRLFPVVLLDAALALVQSSITASFYNTCMHHRRDENHSTLFHFRVKKKLKHMDISFNMIWVRL